MECVWETTSSSGSSSNTRSSNNYWPLWTSNRHVCCTRPLQRRVWRNNDT
jgi:hypothetical protein